MLCVSPTFQFIIYKGDPSLPSPVLSLMFLVCLTDWLGDGDYFDIFMQCFWILWWQVWVVASGSVSSAAISQNLLTCVTTLSPNMSTIPWDIPAPTAVKFLRQETLSTLTSAWNTGSIYSPSIVCRYWRQWLKWAWNIEITWRIYRSW